MGKASQILETRITYVTSMCRNDDPVRTALVSLLSGRMVEKVLES